MPARGAAIGLMGLALLAGCQEQKTVVLEQASAGSVAATGAAPAPRPPQHVHTPCDAPAGTGPFERTDRPAQSQPVRYPQRVIDENVAGCAGIRFRIGADGTPRDLTALTEYPLGYDFAATARQAIEATRWSPRDDLSWHYIVVIRRRAAANTQG